MLKFDFSFREINGRFPKWCFVSRYDYENTGSISTETIDRATTQWNRDSAETANFARKSVSNGYFGGVIISQVSRYYHGQ